MAYNQLLFKYAAKHPFWIVLTTILGFSGAVFNGVSTTLIIPLLLEFVGEQMQDPLNLPPLMDRLLAPLYNISGPYRLILMVGVVLLAIGLKNLANYFSVLTTAVVARRLTRDLREEGLRLLLEVDLDYHIKMKSGDIIQRLNEQVNRTVNAIQTLIGILRIVLNILFFVTLLVALSWQLTLISTGFLVIIVLLNQRIISRSRQFGRYLANASRDYSIRVLEMLNGIRLVKGTANEQREYNTIRQLIESREVAAFKSQANSAAITPLNEFISILALILMVFVGRALFAGEMDTLATVLLTYLFVLSRLIPFLGQLNASRERYANNIASVESVYDFLRRDDKPFMGQGRIPYSPLKTGIHFEKIVFRYPGTNAWVLKDVDIFLPKGQTLALVGASGAGKSTLADLLPRFYDPDKGRIALDGVDLRDFDLTSLRQHMGIVSQDTFLFNASVRENIAYACPEATEREILDAAKRANAYEFIANLPQGLETPLGDRGVLLSGGQRQRLSIARALLQNPDILILDEATSALDTVSERLVQRALDELSRDRTTLVIAHRLSTVQSADQIAVLDQGRVVELGTHAELLELDGYYKTLYAMQFQDQDLEEPMAVWRDRIDQLSYKSRTQLNIMLGSLQLQMESLVDDPKERMELTEEAYKAALNLLRDLEELEQRVNNS